MEESILISTKEILGLGPDDDAFDLDILTHINSALSSLYQLGIGSAFAIEDDGSDWDELVDVPVEQLSMVKSYIFLKVQMLWDPPTTSYLMTAKKEQIAEFEWRLNVMREEALNDV